jgi:DNA phosphorothioation-associated putative methyltransferase
MPKISRHKAAIRRAELSLPAKCLVRDRIVEPGTTYFDYGCGHGEDIAGLRSLGLAASGWDPAFRPDAARQPAEAVNLGYVLNVIEDPAERSQTLQAAWRLCTKVLSIAARILVGGRGKSEVEYGDGVLTRIGTFQKFFTQAELREYIETELNVEVVPAAPGVFYVFRDDELRQRFLAARYRRQAAAPRRRISEVRFEQHRELLEPLIDWVTENGRLPEPDELAGADGIAVEFGSLKRAFALIRRVTDAADWERIRQRRTEDLLVYLALSRFRRRPKRSHLPLALQRDIREFFGTYTAACERADTLLFQAGSPDAVDEACQRSPVGKLLPNALYIHRDALGELEPLLRTYEGCARSYLGEIEDANIVKIHRFSGKVSYLAYPNFDSDPHPTLVRSVKLNMRSLWLDCWDYVESENPPILHRKEAFLAKDDSRYAKFARLTQQEERRGLLDETAAIGTRNGWNARLLERGLELRGHRLVKKKSDGG